MVEPATTVHIEFDELTEEQQRLLSEYPRTVAPPVKLDTSLPLWVCGFEVQYPADPNEVAHEVHLWAVHNEIPFRRLIPLDE